MQDVVMILGLPLEGNAVTSNVQGDGWRDIVEALIGIRPPTPPEGVKDRKTLGVSSAWLRQHFNHCPQGVAREVVERHARAWLWHLFGGFLFPKGSGNTISWMVLPILGQQWENIAQYSWGSATLAWMYRSSMTHVGVLELTQIWVDVPICCRYGFGKGSLWAGHTVPSWRFVSCT